MGRQAVRYGAAKPTPGPTAAVATVNARGVFDSVGDFADGDDQATLMYQPQRRPHGARHASHFPPPVRVVKPAAAPVRRASSPAVAAVRQSEIPAAPRVPAIQLESIPARAPRPSVLAATESTPALSFDADSGEYARVPTMPVPRMPSVAPRANRLPYLAAGVMALAAGALVVLLAGIGKKPSSSFPTAWETGVAASSGQIAQAGAAQLAAPLAPTRPTYAAQPAAQPAAPVRRVAAVQKVSAVPSHAKSNPVMAKPAAAVKPPVVALKPEKPVKADKPSKPSKSSGDEDVVISRETDSIATGILNDSL